jgi:hypothetical protein
MADLTEDLYATTNELTVIIQGKYDLTQAGMVARNQKPLVIGDDFTLQFNLKTSAGAAVNLTGATITFTAKYRTQDTDLQSTLQKAGTIIAPATNGSFTITVAHTDLSALTSTAKGIYDIQVQIGSVVTTVLFGDIEFIADSTKTIV